MLLHEPRCTESTDPIRWGWGDRLCAAHFAVIMFGMVALAGPVHSAWAMFLAVGLVAVMCLAVHGALRFGIGVRVRARRVFEMWTKPCTAQGAGIVQQLRWASRLSGAPPASMPHLFSVFRRRGESDRAFASSVFPRCVNRHVRVTEFRKELQFDE